MATLLALESSCDETAVAIIQSGKPPTLLSSLISSQIDIHQAYGGVVPELASRQHSLRIRPLVEESLREAGLTPQDLDAIGATVGPGLASSLLIGNTFAKGMAFALDLPFLAINHMEGHLLSPFIETSQGLVPHLALIVSGGHTMTIDVNGLGNYQLVGKTIDDAVGEAYDKVARMLDLPYPGGPAIEELARSGNPKAFPFPRSIPKEDHFSFSGLKTAVLYTLEKTPDWRSCIPDLCASFQASVIEVLVNKTIRAALKCQHHLVTVSGGVSCNQALTQALRDRCQSEGLTFQECPRKFSTDNAAMIAYASLCHYDNGSFSPLTGDVQPNLSLVS